MLKIEFSANTPSDLFQEIQAYLQAVQARQEDKPQAAAIQPQQYPAHAPMPAPVPAPAAIPAPVQEPTAPAMTAVPTAAPSYTQADLMTAGARLMTTVGMPAMQELMARFGVQAIHQLKPEQYGAFAQALRNMGAQI